MSLKKLILAALATLAFVSQAHAGLLGSTVTTQYYAYGSTYNGGGSPATFVANGTPQASFFSYYNLTVFDDRVEYLFFSNVTWSSSVPSLNSGGLYITNGNLLTFAGATPITSVSIDPGSTVVPGFTLSNVTYNATNIAVDWQNVTFNQGDRLILSLEPSTDVPEPASLMLLGVGLVGAGFARRRKQ